MTNEIYNIELVPLQDIYATTTGIMNIPVGHFNSRRPLLGPTGIR